MAVEIERKFLVSSDAWRTSVKRSQSLRQGYLRLDGRSSIRVRVAGEAATLTVKSRRISLRRMEFEYPIPRADAEEMLALCEGDHIIKTRHYVEHASHTWEIDKFEGANAGLVLAELELRSAEEPFTRPDWLGQEVSEDPRYYNAALVMHPYRDWALT